MIQVEDYGAPRTLGGACFEVGGRERLHRDSQQLGRLLNLGKKNEILDGYQDFCHGFLLLVLHGEIRPSRCSRAPSAPRNDASREAWPFEISKAGLTRTRCLTPPLSIYLILSLCRKAERRQTTGRRPKGNGSPRRVSLAVPRVFSKERR